MKLFRIKLSELNLMGRLGVKANYLFFSFKHRENIADIICPKYFKVFILLKKIEETNLETEHQFEQTLRLF